MREVKEQINQPITHGLIAEQHTPVYTMHRYFARRPYNVFSYLIEHYVTKDMVILDPFCGGGVTIVEALRQNKKVIGVDLNPMATFITENEIVYIDPDQILARFNKIKSKLAKKINDFYQTNCPNCGKDGYALWFEWAYVFECPNCKSDVETGIAEKKKGKYICDKCQNKFPTSRMIRDKKSLIRTLVQCKHCKKRFEKKTTKRDFKQFEIIKEKYLSLLDGEEIEIPMDELPKGNMEAENSLHAKGFTHFYKFFTERNLLSLALLKKEIERIKNRKLRRLFYLIFSSTIDYSTNISRVVQGAGREITTHSFWPPDKPCENNVWFSFEKRTNATIKGKEYSCKEIGDIKIKTKFDNKFDADTYILTQSSTNLPFENNSIDVIITDPPYGSNVNYIELSDLWAVWLKDELGIKETLDKTEEAICDRHFNFEGAKRIEDYRDLLKAVLKECWRVLKPDGWLVMTFHNREISVWNSLLMASHDSGFALPKENGVIYQPPIKAYITTLHQKRGGSMLGDFILSFKRLDAPPLKKEIEDKEIEDRIMKEVDKVIRIHGGADINRIYMHLMPFLTNEGLLHRIGQKDLEPYLKRNFVKKGELWHLKENIDESGNLKPIKFIPVELRIETLIRSVLSQKKEGVTLDEIYKWLYTNLTNGLTPDDKRIMDILNRVARRIKGDTKMRDRWELGEQKTIFYFQEGKDLDISISPEKVHDSMIEKVALLGIGNGYLIHIGETEQRKTPKFREMSVPMADNVQFGIDKDAFSIIKEIDILILKGNRIVYTVEVVESMGTFVNAINRFRNIFAIMVSFPPKAYILVSDGDLEKANKKLNTPANRKVGLDKIIQIVPYSKMEKYVKSPDFI